MSKNTKYLIGLVAIVLIIAAAAIVAVFRSPSEENSGTENQTAAATVAPDSGSESETTQPTQAPQEKVLPTFMYFVSKYDALYDQAKAVYDELAAEYDGRVRFELKDVDDEPDLKDRFMINLEGSPIPMHTPTLIMLDVNNDISTIGLSECVDKETLKQAIEKALSA